MSGPKVFRIVTREEVVAICRALLAQLDQALNRWIAQMQRTDLATQQEINTMRARRDEIAALIEQDRLIEFQKATPAEMVLLENDFDERLTKEAERQARRRTSRRRMMSVAQTIIGSLEQSSAAPKDLIAGLRIVASGGWEDAGAASSILSRAFQALAPAEEDGTKALTDAQKQLVSALGDDTPIKTLDEWVAGVPSEKTTNDERIDGYIARLETEFGAEVAAPYIERQQALNKGTNASRKRMLTDTLVLDLASEMTHRKERMKTRRKLEELAAELATIAAPTIESARDLVAEALGRNDPDQWDRALTRGRYLLNKARAELAAAARRSTILNEFARLGYEVREGMETALAAQGQVVIRKAFNPEYGVEVFAAPKGQFQVRAVAVGDQSAARDTERDLDMETIWCSEFSEISQAISKTGGEVSIVVAKGVGEVPMKIVQRIKGRGERRPIKAPPKPIERKAP